MYNTINIFLSNRDVVTVNNTVHLDWSDSLQVGASGPLANETSAAVRVRRLLVQLCRKGPVPCRDSGLFWAAMRRAAPHAA